MNRNRRSQFRRRSRGIALLLVISAVAVASILGLAILSSAALRAQTNSNTCRAAEAQFLAESGANLALYFLQHPLDAPATSNGVYSGGNNINIASAMPGTVDLVVQPSEDDSSLYVIVSTAHAGPVAADQMTRILNVSARINWVYQVTNALSAIGDFTMPANMSVTGDVRCDGTFSQTAGGGLLNGTVRAGGSNVSGWQPTPSFPSAACPTLGQMNIIRSVSGDINYYSYLDDAGREQVGTPQLVSGTIIGSLAPAADNPKAVYYATGDLTLGRCTIDGSIILCGSAAKLTVNDVAHITARSGLPALVVTDSVAFQSSATVKSLTVDGVCWIGNSISTTAYSSSNSNMTVNGALMFGGSAPVIGENVGAISVTYDAAKATVPLLSDVDRTPKSIRVVQWGS